GHAAGPRGAPGQRGGGRAHGGGGERRRAAVRHRFPRRGGATAALSERTAGPRARRVRTPPMGRLKRVVRDPPEPAIRIRTRVPAWSPRAFRLRGIRSGGG